MSDYNAKSNIVWGDIDLSEYNAFAFYCNIFDRPERDVSAISIPGRNGDLLFDNGRYKNVERVYQIQVTGLDNIKNLMNDLIAQTGYYRLEDDYDADVYMEARLKSPPATKRFVGDAASITLTFDRKPQRYLKSGDVVIRPSRIFDFTGSKQGEGGAYFDGHYFVAVFNINNESSYTSRPLIKVNGWPFTVEQFWIASTPNGTDVWNQSEYKFQNYVGNFMGGVHPLTSSGNNVPYVSIDCDKRTYENDGGTHEHEKMWLNVGPDNFNDFPMLKTGMNYIRIVYTTYDELGPDGNSYSNYSSYFESVSKYWPEIYPKWVTI